MCMMLASQSIQDWLEHQERLMRAWVEDAALDPGADILFLARLEEHCRWMAQIRLDIGWMADTRTEVRRPRDLM